MSTAALMPTSLDLLSGDSAFENRRNSSSSGCRYYDARIPAGVYGMGNTAGMDSRQWQLKCSSTTTTTTTAFFSIPNNRHRNLSGPCSSSNPRPLDNRALVTPPPGVGCSRVERDSHRDKENHHPHKEGSNNGRHGSSATHRKLDRSLSDTEDRINGNNSSGGRGVNSSRYKTELCRPFEERGQCKYGDKCQFAHGADELRNLTRHPKYKTERCRTYHTIGFCPYGPRCHFIHNEDEQLVQRKNSHNAKFLSVTGGQGQCALILPPSSANSNVLAHRPSNLCGLNSLGSSFESVSSPSSSPGNLSPSHLESTFPTIDTFSPSAVEPRRETGQDSEPMSVFNFPASDAPLGSIMTPLNIQTQQMYNNALDMDWTALAHFSAVMNISQNHQNNQSFSANLNLCRQQQQVSGFELDATCTSSSAAEQCWPVSEPLTDLGMPLPPKSSSPHSSESTDSSDSMGSNGSLELAFNGNPLDNAGNLINSPLDLGRSMRLPIFNKLSLESES